MSLTRYDLVSRRIHWSIAGLLLLAFGAGLAADATGAAGPLMAHVGLGFTAALLSVARLVWWWRRAPVPPFHASGPKQALAAAVHVVLALAPLALVATGMAVISAAGGPGTVFGDTSLPDFDALPPRGAHFALAFAFLALVVLHVAAGFGNWLRTRRT